MRLTRFNRFSLATQLRITHFVSNNDTYARNRNPFKKSNCHSFTDALRVQSITNRIVGSVHHLQEWVQPTRCNNASIKNPFCVSVYLVNLKAICLFWCVGKSFRVQQKCKMTKTKENRRKMRDIVIEMIHFMFSRDPLHSMRCSRRGRRITNISIQFSKQFRLICV